MPTSAPTELPLPPYPDAPYIINDEWCIGDSIDIINANTEYFENNKVNRSGDTMTGELIVQDNITIENNGNLDLNCGYLKDFSVEVKNINITPITPGLKYVIDPSDCGKVLVITSTTNVDITVPSGLKLGFNIMLVSNTTFQVRIIPDPVLGVSGVLVRNFQNANTIYGRWGICNFVMIESNPSIGGSPASYIALISGDLN